MGHRGRKPWRRPGVERGAALVEFALILPVFMMLVLGTFTGAIAYNQKLDLAHAAHEGARYGATLPENQTTFTSPATSWATAVQQVVVERSAGDLTSAQVCVALVDGNPPAAVDGSHQVNVASGQSNCYDDGSGDAGKRVQVAVARPGSLEALVFSMNLNLSARAVAKFESDT
jgi:Flp pilus assembly protein TadG